MSSAALQTSPHQAVNLVSSLSSPSSGANRQYATQSPPSRDPYYGQPPTNTTASSQRRPGRRPSGNGSTSSPQQTQYMTAASAPNTASNTVPRGSSQTQEIPKNNTSTYAASNNDNNRGAPPNAPPRTSSNSRSAAASSSAAQSVDKPRRNPVMDERAMHSARPPATAGNSDYGSNSGPRQSNSRPSSQDGNDTTAASTARSRRAQPAAQETMSFDQGGSAQEPRPTASTSQSYGRTQPSRGSGAPAGPSREGSEIINRVVVSKPEIDIERERERLAEAQPSNGPMPPQSGLSVVGSEGLDDAARVNQKSRHDHANDSGKKEKTVKFGEYFLGNTLGEGEFGKVKMGWKQEGGIQVAIKLIRRENVGSNPTRLAKIYREIAILREISHPNIVRLHEMVETDRHIGIILEYASGGELFDYILNHRYLKDNAARRLFAQLVSGVGYLHKKGIVHRDLKLENLLLDRNRNIIITDFGFANTFNPADELGEEAEYGLGSREYVKKMELDKILPGGFRRGDLMQTSCGSPCYAAPELVVSDSLYTGRKVDVWSCGVILYAMLAGYLPFDDDPANPEGDNINLLYKYIVSTPLTFPEYVTPHARDLLRRILVPDPRKRADLFEVARHSWLNEYSHVVGFITSSTTTTSDIANTTISADDSADPPLLGRSASVREPAKTSKSPPAVGDLARKHGNVDPTAEEPQTKTSKDNKRRTVQLEYVPPKSQTVRGEDTPSSTAPPGRSRARSGSQGPVEVAQPVHNTTRRPMATEKPLPQEPKETHSSASSSRPSTTQRQPGMPPPTRPVREPPRSVSDNAFMSTPMATGIARPTTGGSMASSMSGRGSMGLQSRASYGQPVAPTVAGTTATGRMSQPKSGKGYTISAPIQPEEEEPYTYNRPSSSHIPAKFAQISGFQDSTDYQPAKTGHRRSNTSTSITEKLFGRRGSFFGGRASRGSEQASEKSKKSYPPISMSTAMPGNHSRPSMDSRRSISWGLGRKRSGSVNGSGDGASTDKSAKRFSLIPSGFSLKAIGIGKESRHDSQQDLDQRDYEDQSDSRDEFHDPPTSSGQPSNRPAMNESCEQEDNRRYGQGAGHSVQHGRRESASATPPQRQRYASTSTPLYDEMTQGNNAYTGDSGNGNGSRSQQVQEYRNEANQSATRSGHQASQNSVNLTQTRYPPGFNDEEEGGRRLNSAGPPQRSTLQKNNRRFDEGYSRHGQEYSGSSGAARKVMDFFRRRGKDRGDE